jgi:DNA (cytosine-5)-methyltransferase 1
MVELFAGVGGFRLGLEPHGWETVWANQWEPSTRTQHAAACYRYHFPDPDVLSDEDINVVVERMEREGWDGFPDHDLLVGGFPCQDYSVAKVRSQAHGIAGKKGVLWWAIHAILEAKRPRLVFLENVDRLLKSPASQRGRDFAIILACLSDLDYLVEWRVVNAADYGFPQRRRRVFLIAHHVGEEPEPEWSGPMDWLASNGAFARGLPVSLAEDELDSPNVKIDGDLSEVTDHFGRDNKVTPFLTAGVMWRRQAWTTRASAAYDGPYEVLRDVLQNDDEVPRSFLIPKSQLPRWRELKGPKSVPRVARNGHRYVYSEGGIAFPDPLDRPSRTILTGEGGSTPSRFKHVIAPENGLVRRLTPIELERLNGFRDDWTNTGMSDGRRAFMMGNALVVGLVDMIGASFSRDASGAREDLLR